MASADRDPSLLVGGVHLEAAAALRELAEAARELGSPTLWALLGSYANAAERGDAHALSAARRRLVEDVRWYRENAPNTRPLRVMSGALKAVLTVAPEPRIRIVLEATTMQHIVLRIVNGERRVVRGVRGRPPPGRR